MASAPTWLHQNSSMSGSDSDSDSDSDSENEMENDSYGDNESTESLSSFDQSEEEDDLSSEGITEDLVAGHLQSEFGNDEEKPLEVEEVTDVSSSDLKIAGLTKCEEVLRKLSKLIWRTLSNSKFVSLLKDFVESEFFLIDGDSLFITCVFNVSLKEGQTLHFFYIVEQFLSDFIQKGARFVIVFFKKKINIVLFLGQETDVLRIYGYHAPSVYSHKEFFEKHEKQLQHALHAYTREYFQMLQKRGIFLYGRMKLNLEDMQKEIHQTLSLLQNLWPEGADVRGVVCSVSCSVTLKLYEKMLCHGQACENLNTCTENCKTQDWEGAPTLNEAGDLCRMLCLSVIFLQHLSLFQRAKSRIVTHTWDRTLSPFLRMLKTCEFFILKQLKINNNWKVNFTSLPDLTDKILWKNIIYYYEVEYCKELNLELGNTLTQEYEKLWNSVLTLSGGCDFGEPVPLRRTSRPFLRQKEIPKKKK
ncbi:probable ATP-dependent RNA helicase DDX60, partial [Elephas maximus indicus]|uniref:probable ATP-dependent RNA helicase DDX60 n=1 Tax=Elephas maximus indicus TaxID=99487 RepID=UPI002116B668